MSGATGHVAWAFLGSYGMLMGLLMLMFRRELFSGPSRITMAKLREYPPVMWGRGMALGLAGVNAATAGGCPRR